MNTKRGIASALTGLAAMLAPGCKPSERAASPHAIVIGAKAPITVSPTDSGYDITFGFHFRSTINQPEYRITEADCGFVLRFARTEGTKVTLPLLPFPCALMLFSERANPVAVTLEGTAPDGTGGDFNGEKSFNLGDQEGAILHVNQSSAFYRGLFTCRGGYGGCAGSGGGTAPAPTPIASKDLTDFSITQPSNKKIAVGVGHAAVGAHTFPQPISGDIEFTAGSGPAHIYISKQGLLTTSATVGTTAKMSGGMILLTEATPSFPSGSIPIASITLNNGTYTLDHSNLASRIRSYPLDAGSGVSLSATQGVSTIAVDQTVARRDSDNIWTGTNDFTNANIVGTTMTATQQTTKYVSWLALVLAICATLIALFRNRIPLP